MWRRSGVFAKAVIFTLYMSELGVSAKAEVQQSHCSSQAQTGQLGATTKAGIQGERGPQAAQPFPHLSGTFLPPHCILVVHSICIPSKKLKATGMQLNRFPAPSIYRSVCICVPFGLFPQQPNRSGSSEKVDSVCCILGLSLWHRCPVLHTPCPAALPGRAPLH